MKKFSKILSVLLCVAMLLGLAAVVGAEGETATFTKVTAAPTDWSGTYLLVYESSATSAKVLNGSALTDAENNYVTADITDGTITMDSAYSVTIESVTGGYTIKGSDGNYIYSSSDGNKLALTTDGNTAAKYPNTLAIDESGILDIYSSSKAHLRFNDNASNGQRFRYYKSTSYANQMAVSLYKLNESGGEGGGEEADPTTAGLVTNVADLKDGGKIYLGSYSNNAAMGTLFVGTKGNYMSKVDATYSEDFSTLTIPEGAVQVTLEKHATEESTYALKVDGGYIVYPGAGNYATVSETAEYWTISIDKYGFAVIVNCTDSTRYLQYNSSSPRFSCYTGSQSSPSIYMLDHVGSVPASSSVTGTIADCLAADKGITCTTTGVVNYVSPIACFIQDSTGGLYIYVGFGSSMPEGVVQGAVINVTGTRDTYHGLSQLKDPTITVTTETKTLTPKETTIGALTESDIGIYIKLSNVEVAAVEGSDITIKDGEDSIVIKSAVLGDTTLKVGDKLNVCATLSTDDGLQLVNTTSSEIEVIGSSTPGEGEDKPGEGEEKPGEGEEKPGEGEEKPGDKTTVTVTAGTKIDSLVNGDKIVIYYPEGDTVIGDTADGSKLTPVAAKWSDKYLLYANGMAEFTVTVDSDGYYTFTCNGKYLTSAETGNGLTLEDNASDLSKWTLEATDGGYFVKNKAAAYNDNPQYLEHYKGFTTYGKGANANPAYYTFQFYKLGEVEIVVDAPSQTGDVNLSIVVALMAVSALSVTALVAKKKEF